MVGQAVEGGGFGPFPFYKLPRLSDAPSKATNALAAAILRQLGLGEDKLQEVLRLSVKEVIPQTSSSSSAFTSNLLTSDQLPTTAPRSPSTGAPPKPQTATPELLFSSVFLSSLELSDAKVYEP